MTSEPMMKAAEAREVLKRHLPSLDAAAIPTKSEVFVLCGHAARETHDAITALLATPQSPSPNEAAAEVEALEEALKPFRRALDCYAPQEDDHHRIFLDASERDTQITVGNLRRLIAAARSRPTPEAEVEAVGWLYFSPDSGEEWAEQHPIESGEVSDAQNVRPATAEELLTLLKAAWADLSDARAIRSRSPGEAPTPQSPSGCVDGLDLDALGKVAGWAAEGRLSMDDFLFRRTFTPAAVVRLIALARQSSGSPPIGSVGEGASGWLIEGWNSKTSEFNATWWSLDDLDSEDGFGWTKDSAKALRFARACDAQAYIDDIGWTEAKPTEHVWGTLPSPDAQQGEAAPRDPQKLWARDLTNEELVAEHARVEAVWGELNALDDEDRCGGGSPGEGTIERLDELDAEMKKRSLSSPPPQQGDIAPHG